MIVPRGECYLHSEVEYCKNSLIHSPLSSFSPLAICTSNNENLGGAWGMRLHIADLCINLAACSGTVRRKEVFANLVATGSTGFVTVKEWLLTLCTRKLFVRQRLLTRKLMLSV